MILRALSICTLLVAITGCGDGISEVPVTGTVTLDGTPISGAAITFQPVPGGTGMPAIGNTDANGAFTVSDLRAKDIGNGAVAGDYQVGVLWFKPSANDSSQATGASGGGEESSQKDDRASRSKVSGPDALLPAAYQNPSTSGLTASVSAGSDNKFTFELDSKFKPATKK